MIAKFCSTSGSLQDNELCIQMLTSFDKEDIHEFLEEADLPSVNLNMIQSHLYLVFISSLVIAGRMYCAWSNT